LEDRLDIGRELGNIPVNVGWRLSLCHRHILRRAP
jgi:hypothetical protein